jgi:hypothetical protein
MVEQHVNGDCEDIKNCNYKDHSPLGEMHTIIQSYVGESGLQKLQYNYNYL